MDIFIFISIYVPIFLSILHIYKVGGGVEADNKSANLEASIVKEEAVPLLAPDFKVYTHIYISSVIYLYYLYYYIYCKVGGVIVDTPYYPGKFNPAPGSRSSSSSSSAQSLQPPPAPAPALVTVLTPPSRKEDDLSSTSSSSTSAYDAQYEGKTSPDSPDSPNTRAMYEMNQVRRQD